MALADSSVRLTARAGEEAEIGFKVHPRMPRHACGYALANKGLDTRTLQDLSGPPLNQGGCRGLVWSDVTTLMGKLPK